MERQGLPDQDPLLQFLKRLKEVFDVCDEDADGFIRVEHLMDLGLQFGQGDEVSRGEWKRQGGLVEDKRLANKYYYLKKHPNIFSVASRRIMESRAWYLDSLS